MWRTVENRLRRLSSTSFVCERSRQRRRRSDRRRKKGRKSGSTRRQVQKGVHKRRGRLATGSKNIHVPDDDGREKASRDSASRTSRRPEEATEDRAVPRQCTPKACMVLKVTRVYQGPRGQGMRSRGIGRGEGRRPGRLLQWRAEARGRGSACETVDTRPCRNSWRRRGDTRRGDV